jgi:uncharacterized DUF497 family protein
MDNPIWIGPGQGGQKRAKAPNQFETAIRVFSDPLALLEQDRIEEVRTKMADIGNGRRDIALLVAHSVWEDEAINVIRIIISARRATASERRRYEQGKGLS